MVIGEITIAKQYLVVTYTNFYFKNYLFTKFIYTFIASTGVYPIGLAMKNTSKCMIKGFFESIYNRIQPDFHGGPIKDGYQQRDI